MWKNNLFVAFTLFWMCHPPDAQARDWTMEIERNSVMPTDIMRAIIQTESAGNPTAVSNKRAMGLTQVTAIALDDIMLNHTRLPKKCSAIHGGIDLYDPQLNILAGSCFLKLMTLTFYTLDAAIMAYNAGPTRIRKWINGKASLPRETSNYLVKVNFWLNKYKEKT